MTVEVTWWGASCVEVGVGDRRIVIDPWGPLDEPRFRAVCVTREDHDHLDPVALRALVGPDCERVLLPRACQALDRISAPIVPGATDLTFLDPGRTVYLDPGRGRDPEDAHSAPVEVAGFTIEAWESSPREPASIIERWVRLKGSTETAWPADRSPLAASGEFAPLGYLVTDQGSGVSVYHPGDLQEVFDAHRSLRGAVDVMFLPLPSTEGIVLSLVDAVRPSLVVPIHYRPAIEAVPLPTTDRRSVDLESGYPEPGATTEEYRTELQSLICAGWFPTPADPDARLIELQRQLGALDVGFRRYVVGRTMAVAPGGRIVG